MSLLEQIKRVRAIVITLTVLVTLIAILIAITEDARYSRLSKPKYLGPIRDDVPSKSAEFGRYKKPFAVIDYSWISPSLYKFVSLKHWDFKSISTSRYFIVAALANFNYLANAFVYVIDRTNSTNPIYQYSARSLLARDCQEQAKSSINGCTQFRRSASEFIRLCYNPGQKVYDVEVNVPLNSGIPIAIDFHMDFASEKDDSMVLLYPIQEDRPAYTHKVAGLSARGKIRIGNQQQEDLLDGVGSIDWTLAYSERISHWKWVSLSTLGRNTSNNESVTIGINLSDVVYNDENGVSMESAIWIAGQIYTVNHRVIYELPAEQYQTRQPWHIYSVTDAPTDDPLLDLTFQPWGSQEEHVNVIILIGNFVQAFGVYTGTIQLFGHTYVIENGFGVAENHYAKW